MENFEAVIYEAPFEQESSGLEGFAHVQILGNIDLVGARGFVRTEELAKLKGTSAEVVFGGYRGMWKNDPEEGLVCVKPFSKQGY